MSIGRFHFQFCFSLQILLQSLAFSGRQNEQQCSPNTYCTLRTYAKKKQLYRNKLDPYWSECEWLSFTFSTSLFASLEFVSIVFCFSFVFRMLVHWFFWVVNSRIFYVRNNLFIIYSLFRRLHATNLKMHWRKSKTRARLLSWAIIPFEYAKHASSSGHKIYGWHYSIKSAFCWIPI